MNAIEMNGKKSDQDKLRWDLLPMTEVRQVVEVLTMGAKKYGDNNWKEVDNAIERYFGACMRHIVHWREGEKADKESGLHHLAHAITNLIFIMNMEKRKAL